MQACIALADFKHPLSTNVNISDYELQILKNTFVTDVNSYLTRQILS